MGKNRIALQHKILLGYSILVAVIFCTGFILWHERRQMQAVESEMERLWQLHEGVHASHRHITGLALQGETAVGWGDEEQTAYHALRMRTDSLLASQAVRNRAYVPEGEIDTLRHLLAEKEAMLAAMTVLRRQREASDRQLARELPEAVREATRMRQVTVRKTGLAGLLGGKKTVQVAPKTDRLRELNRRITALHEKQAEGIGLRADSLMEQNEELNRRLIALVERLDSVAEAAFLRHGKELDEIRVRSFRTLAAVSGVAIVLLVISYLIIQRDVKQKAYSKDKMEGLIAELRQSVRQNESLIASRKKAVHTITHELRTPLAAITGYAGLMQGGGGKDKRGLYIQNIQQSSDRMRTMLNTLLDFFRLDNGKEQPNLSPCRISAITRTLETEFMSPAMNKGLALTVQCRGDAVVRTDKERILQIGDNLLSNAIKFTENGSVTLSAAYCHGILTLVVEDTGTGMGEEEQHRVFEAFERLSNAATQDGFGLGLAIVQRIVVMLGGTVRLESRKGKGSRFTVEIPMQAVEELPGQTVQGPARCSGRYHDVIAIDNDKVLLQMLKEMYAQDGIRCDTCTDAAELMEMIRRKTYSLLLTDLKMPDMNGFELLELLRTSNVGNSKAIPVVVTTASGSCSKDELIERGFAGCLYKPFSLTELMEISDECAMKGTQAGKPDLSFLLSYGNESVMLEKLITETEKEMQALKDAEQHKDLQELEALTHHLRSSWEILRADAPLRELYRLVHGSGTPDDEAMGDAVQAVLDNGSEIIRLAKEERRRYDHG